MLDRMAALTPERIAALRAAHPCDTAADYRDDQLLDTMLGRTECVLATGEPMLPFTPAQLEKMREDPAVALMLAAVSPKNKEEYEGAVKTLASAITASAGRYRNPSAPGNGAGCDQPPMT